MTITCGWEGEDTTCPEFDDDTSLDCTAPATKMAIIEVPDPDEGWQVQILYSCDAHATPLVEDAHMRVAQQWSPSTKRWGVCPKCELPYNDDSPDLCRCRAEGEN